MYITLANCRVVIELMTCWLCKKTFFSPTLHRGMFVSKFPPRPFVWDWVACREEDTKTAPEKPLCFGEELQGNHVCQSLLLCIPWSKNAGAVGTRHWQLNHPQRSLTSVHSPGFLQSFLPDVFSDICTFPI